MIEHANVMDVPPTRISHTKRLRFQGIRNPESRRLAFEKRPCLLVCHDLVEGNQAAEYRSARSCHGLVLSGDVPDE